MPADRVLLVKLADNFAVEQRHEWLDLCQVFGVQVDSVPRASRPSPTIAALCGVKGKANPPQDGTGEVQRPGKPRSVQTLS